MSDRIGEMVLSNLSNDIRRLLMEQRAKLNEAEKNFGGSFNVSIPVKFGISPSGGVKWETHLKFYLDQVDATAVGSLSEGQQPLFDSAKNAQKAMEGLNQPEQKTCVKCGAPIRMLDGSEIIGTEITGNQQCSVCGAAVPDTWFGCPETGGATEAPSEEETAPFHCGECDYGNFMPDINFFAPDNYLGCTQAYCMCTVCHTSAHQLTHWKAYKEETASTEINQKIKESTKADTEDLDISRCMRCELADLTDNPVMYKGCKLADGEVCVDRRGA